MSLLQPLGLLGLLALPVIVLLHLLHERSRRAIVPSLALWRWLEPQVRGPRMRRPPITPVLLLQLAAATLLSLALARPRLDAVAGPAVLERLIIVVDTTTSMGATDVSPSRLARAQAQAAARLAGLGENDSAVLITAGPRPHTAADSLNLGLVGVLAALAELQPAGVGQDWQAALALAAAAVLPDRRNHVVIYSDGAFVFPVALEAEPYPVPITWERVGAPQPNQAVVTLAARPTGSGGAQVFARLANFANTAAERTVTLLADGQVFDTHSVSFSASGTLDKVWTLPPSVGAVEVRLSPGDVLPADDSAALGLLEPRPVEALLVSASPGAVERALRSIPGLRLSVAAPEAYVPFNPRGLTVFDGWLPEAWPNGGVLVFNLPPDNGLLPVRGVARISSVPPGQHNRLLADVDLEHVSFGLTALLAAPEAIGETDLQGQDANENAVPLILRGASPARMVVFTFYLADSNIARRASFPVLVANAVAEVLPLALPASLPHGAPLPLPAPEIFRDVLITDPAGQQFALGPDRPGAFDLTGQPGLYRLSSQLPTGQVWGAAVGVNAGALDESDLRLQAAPVFSAVERPFAAGPSAGLELWPLLAALAALVMVAEARAAWR
jgi:Ca-activated chloride channel family protein